MFKNNNTSDNDQNSLDLKIFKLLAAFLISLLIKEEGHFILS